MWEMREIWKNFKSDFSQWKHQWTVLKLKKYHWREFWSEQFHNNLEMKDEHESQSQNMKNIIFGDSLPENWALYCWFWKSEDHDFWENSLNRFCLFQRRKKDERELMRLNRFWRLEIKEWMISMLEIRIWAKTELFSMALGNVVNSSEGRIGF
jgi:hypothetical protein